eukprot:m.392483 g.392483  ORF g.392483 m.392483 type:complete len:1090 (-) comp56350_c0_seq2:85-3354(-)
MSWFKNARSQLGGLAQQVSTFTNDVLADIPAQDAEDEFNTMQSHLEQLTTQCAQQAEQLRGLAAERDEALRSQESTELQISQMSKEYRRLIQEKEDALVRQRELCTDLELRIASQTAQPPLADYDSDRYARDESTESHLFKDSLSSLEFNRLRQECEHWKQLAQLHASETPGDLESATRTIAELELKLERLVDEHQDQIAAMQELALARPPLENLASEDDDEESTSLELQKVSSQLSQLQAERSQLLTRIQKLEAKPSVPSHATRSLRSLRDDLADLRALASTTQTDFLQQVQLMQAEVLERLHSSTFHLEASNVQLRAEYAELLSNYQHSQADLATATTSQASMTAESHQREQENIRLRRQLEETSSLLSATDARAAASARLAQAEDERAQLLEQQLHELQEQVLALRQLSQTQSGDLQQLANQDLAKDNEILGLRQQLQQERSETHRQATQLASQSEALQSARDEISAFKVAAEAAPIVATVQQSEPPSRDQATPAESDERQQRAQDEIELLRKELEALEEDKQNADSVIVQLRERISQSTQSHSLATTHLQDRISELSRRLDESQQQVTEHLSTISSLKEVASTSRHSVAEESEAKVALEAEINQMRTLIERLKLASQAAEQKCELLVVTCEQLRVDRALAVAEAAESKHNASVQLTQLEAQQGQLQLVQSELTRATTAEQDLRHAVKSLETQLASGHAEIQQQNQAELRRVQELRSELEDKAEATAAQQQTIGALMAKIKGKDEVMVVLQQKISSAQMQPTGASLEVVQSERDKAVAQLRALQEHLLQLEASYTEEALRRDEHVTAMQSQLKEKTEQANKEMVSQVQRNHELAKQVDVLEAEIFKARRARDEAEKLTASFRQELEHATLSVSNLELVLQNFEVEKESAVSLVRVEFSHKLEAISATLAASNEIVEEHAACERNAQALKAKILQLEGDVNQSKGMCASLSHDVLRLQAQLSEAVAKLQASSQTLVEKVLVRNMLLQYFGGAHKGEVMILIANLLDFSDDERRRAGIGSSGLLGWLTGSGARRADGAQSTQSTLSEEFIRYMLTEANRPDSVPSPTPTRARTITHQATAVTKPSSDT